MSLVLAAAIHPVLAQVFSEILKSVSMHDKGWFTILCLYNSLEPFFAKTWRPFEIKLAE